MGSEKQEELAGSGDKPRPPGGGSARTDTFAGGCQGPGRSMKEEGGEVGRERRGLLCTEGFQSHSIANRTEKA